MPSGSRSAAAVVCAVVCAGLVAASSVRCRAADDKAAAGGGDPAPAVPDTVDAGDVWRHVRHKPPADPDASADQPEKPFFFVAPSITSKPSTGLLLGVATALAFVHGDTDTTHMSSVTANVKVSARSQALSSVRFGMFSSEDKWFLQGDNRFQWTSLNVGGLGLDSPASKDNIRYDWFRVYETGYRRVGDSRLFAGFGLNINDHTNVRPGASSQAASGPSAYLAYTVEHQFDPDRQISSGANVGLLFDTRDNAINAGRGWLANATYRMFFDGFLGGNASWHELSVDMRTYRKLTSSGRQKLAFWMLGDFVTSGTAPYFDLPATSGDLYGRSARGYAEGAYRGPHLMYGEVEYRDSLVPSGLLGMVAFFNVTTVDGDADGQKLFRSYAPGSGLGLRILLNKRSRTNLCADYGVGRAGSHGFYLAVQEAF
jgi:outer membrane protein assembly factor BamA